MRALDICVVTLPVPLHDINVVNYAANQLPIDRPIDNDDGSVDALALILARDDLA